MASMVVRVRLHDFIKRRSPRLHLDFRLRIHLGTMDGRDALGLLLVVLVVLPYRYVWRLEYVSKLFNLVMVVRSLVK